MASICFCPPEDLVTRMCRDIRDSRDQLNRFMKQMREEHMLLDDPPPAKPDRAAPALLVLRPGDKVLVALAEDVDDSVCEGILRSLKASFPGVEFTVLSGVTALAVMPPS
jgi:hypothetical protein